MKTKLLLAALLLLVAHVGCGQVTFQKVIVTDGNAAISSVHQTFDGGYICTGQTNVNQPNRNIFYLIKTDTKGEVIWTRGFSDTTYTSGYGVQQTADTGFVAVGTSNYPSTYKTLSVIKTNSNGDTVWTKSYGGIEEVDGTSIQQTKDGGYIIVGTAYNFGAGGTDVYLLKINSNGNIQWNKTYGGPAIDYGSSVKQTSDSGFIIVGNTLSFGSGNRDIYLIKTDVNGDTLWTRAYGGSNIDIGYSVEQTKDGGYIIGGSTLSYGAGNVDCYLIKTKANGDTLWTKTYGGANDEIIYDVMQTNDSGYIFTGYTLNLTSGTSTAYLVKTDINGDTLWTKMYNSPLNNSTYAVNQTNDDGYVIGGYYGVYDLTHSYYGAYLLKTNTNGDAGCNQGSTRTIVGNTQTNISFTHTLISSGGSEHSYNPQIQYESKDTTLCTSVGIPELTDHKPLLIYPNPAYNELIIDNGQLKIKSIEIYNVLGEKVLPAAPLQMRGEYVIDVSALSRGLYFLRVVSKDGVQAGKFVKE